jgi:hypothetical protein
MLLLGKDNIYFPFKASQILLYHDFFSNSKEEYEEACEGDEQCLYDSAAMGSLDIGRRTRDAHRFYRLLHENMKSGTLNINLINKISKLFY